jgi:hypothetical protein
MRSLPRWDSELDGESSLEIFRDLALSHCSRAGTYGSSLRALISARDWLGVCEYELAYDGSVPVDALIHIRQALAFFTKLEFLDVGIDKDEVAFNKFYDSEGACLRTNRLLNLSASGDFCFPRDVWAVMSTARRKIDKVLGECPSIPSLDYFFGPGATTSVRKINACARTKLSAVPSCSTNLLPLLPLLTEELPRYFGIHAVDEGTRCPVEIHSGRLSFVPKNAKTSRTVMTEPTLNALVQGGFGRIIADRLLRVGQDIRNQQRQHALAREGSLLGNLATLDLVSASDSISTELVAFLLPYEWFAALSLCRTPEIALAGDRKLSLHKFSSMGNGFTFPLQTLIFWALAQASVERSSSPEKRVSVYGDDIILGTGAVPLFSKVLHCTGFTLNKAKSYSSGSFRESCGRDYYAGIDIRPFYARSFVSGEFLFLLHNFYYRSFDFDMAAKVLGLIPDHLRIFGPDGYGDGHLLGGSPRPHKRRQGYGGYVFDTYRHGSRYHRKVLPGDHVLPAYSIYARESTQDRLVPTIRIVSGRPESDDSDLGPTRHMKDRDGSWYPALVTPGTKGYKRISIYTLTPS